MHQHLPFPVAFPYHLIDAARTPAERYQRMLHCYEAVVRYCAIVQLSDYLAAGCPDAALNRRVLDRCGQTFSLGHWVELTRSVAALQKDRVFPAFLPELAAFYFRAGGKHRPTPEAEIFDSALLAARNEWAHPDQTWSADTFATKYAEQRPQLDTLIAALGFLGRYTLYVPTAGSPQGEVTAALHLMGPTDPPRHLEKLDIPLTPRVLAHLEYETTAFLCDPADPARQLLLCPLSLFANRDGSEDIFLFNGCDLQKQSLRHLHYRAVRVNQKPLKISPGSGYEAVVEQFRDLLRCLESTAPPTGTAATPSTAVPVVARPDSSGLYFAAQKEFIREQVAGFVGRKALEDSVEEFIARNPRGFVVVYGGPGQGKTAVACRQVTGRDATHHLISATGGRDVPHLILGSLLAQLSAKLGAPEEIPAGLQERTKLFEDFLTRAASRGERVVVVIDALDELGGEADALPPFLPTESLPAHVFFVVTTRPGTRFKRLLDAISRLPNRVLELPPLELDDIATIVRSRRPNLTDGEVERIAEACQGNPLYLHAVGDELTRNPGFNLSTLPAGIEGFFREATALLRRDSNALGRDVLGLLTVARKPLSARELGQITNRRHREIDLTGVAPVRQFLFEENDGYSFYHAKFRDFVSRELLYPDELPEYHRMLAAWLSKRENRHTDYRWLSLAHHLFEGGDTAELRKTVDAAFLEEKARRFGYAVLEDVELLSRTLLADDDPNVVEHCVKLVEGVRNVVGGDVIGDAGWAMRSFQPGPAAFRSRVVEPCVPDVPGLDLYVGMLPKIEVGADFFEVIPIGLDRVVLVLGDAPGAGLKPAFVARFLGNVIRKHIERDGRDLARVIEAVNRTIAGADFFDAVSVQVVELAPRAGRARVVNAGLPFPVLWSQRRGKADQLPVYGEPVQPHPMGDTPPRWEQRQVEAEPGDVFVMVTDGLTEGWRPRADAYHYGFTRILSGVSGVNRTAREIGEAILDDWRTHPRDRDYSDDTTVIVAVFK